MINQPLDEHTWSVGELTNYIREIFEIDYRLQDLTVVGEISNFIKARSGHLYFTLKDEQAQLKCVMWRTQADKLGFKPENGDEIIAYGRITVYEAGGQYQLYADTLAPVGRGNLALAFEQLKIRLEIEGLFNPEFKKGIPEFPTKIGLVTSADGAALRDIINVLERRWPIVRVLLAPTLVQGVDAPSMIVRAIQWLDGRDDIDTIILARGGGSMEDLWAFNDEEVARAIFSAEVPIISGVGHETDFTIADFVADLRAPTPSAAAELSVPDQLEQKNNLNRLQLGLNTLLLDYVSDYRMLVDGFARALIHLSPRSYVDSNRQTLDNFAMRLDRSIKRVLELNQTRLDVNQVALASFNPISTLSRGYAIVRKKDGDIVRSVNQVVTDDKLDIQVSDGRIPAQVD